MRHQHPMRYDRRSLGLLLALGESSWIATCADHLFHEWGLDFGEYRGVVYSHEFGDSLALRFRYPEETVYHLMHWLDASTDDGESKSLMENHIWSVRTILEETV